MPTLASGPCFVRLRFSIPPLLLCALGALFGSHVAAAQPNILLFRSDDLGYADIGVNGCQDIPRSMRPREAGGRLGLGWRCGKSASSCCGLELLTASVAG